MKLSVLGIATVVGSAIAGNVLVKVNSFTTARCDCDVGEFNCKIPSFSDPQCQGGCAHGGAWCNPMLYICIGSKPFLGCPDVNDDVTCNLYNSATDSMQDVLTADFDFLANVTVDEKIPNDIFVKISPFHDHGGAPEALGKPTIQCFSFNDLQSWESFDTPALDTLVKLACPYGLYGSKCDQRCETTNHNMHCNAIGETRCNPGWAGEDCSVGCRNTTNYYCDSSNGNHVCRQGFHVPPNCEVECMANGQYTCDINGNKVCLSGRYGEDCEKECFQSETTTCDSKGNKICKANYYKSDCSVYCVEGPSNTCDRADGTKNCLTGYEMRNRMCMCAPENFGCVESDSDFLQSTIAQNNDNSLSPGAIVGFVIAALLVIGVVGCIIFYCIKSKKSSKKKPSVYSGPPVMARA
eukprot:CFRG4931T1